MTLTWTTETRRLGDLIKWDANPRQLTNDQAVRLRRSIAEFGYSQLYEIEPDNTIIDGHQRDEIMLRMDDYGEDAEIEVRVSSRKLSLEERKEYIALKHRGAVGEWNWDAMHNLYDFEELADWGFDADELLQHGFEANEEVLDDPGAEVDRADELREKWGVQSGQLWQLGEHRLICGDCTDGEVVGRVMDGEKADMVYADPPYGIDLDTDYSKLKGTHKSPNAMGYEYEQVIGDDKPFDFTPFYSWDYKEQFWFGADYYSRQLPTNGSWFVWLKRNEADATMIGNDFELCWSKKKHKRQAIRIRWVGWDATEKSEKRTHPTQKPVDLAIWFIERYGNDIILDPFLGSGTTLIACERLNRKCRAVEISPAYCAVAIERWHEMTGLEPVLLDA